MDLLSAALSDRYAIQKKLGAGGMATVWLARDLKYQRPVALKVLHTELASRIGVERFHREIAIAARLTHPHILPLFESGEAAGAFYYTMPCLSGDTLRDRLTRERQLPFDDALEITRAVAEALDYAHRQGVVHRDIKPENILFHEGQAVVADFGIARAVAAAQGDTLTTPGVAIGTVHYMSPEQAAGSPAVDGRSDVYALGCVLYEMLAGVPPFQGATLESVLRQHITADPPSLAPHRPGLPDAVDAVVRKALVKSPVDRWSSGADLVAALEATRAAATHRPWAVKVRGVAALGVVALGALAFLGWRLFAPRARLDPNLVAVAPFEVLEPRLAPWREGLATGLARNLDGAGPLRAVSAATSGAGTAAGDQAAAGALGRHLGAGVVVSGTLVASGADSVHLTLAAADVATGRVLGTEVSERGAESRLDRVLESATIRLVVEMGRTRRIGAGRLASLGSVSLPAVKAFLQGEQYFRRSAWDSAAVFYDEAIHVDSTFALALDRVAQVRGLQRGFPGSEDLDMAVVLRAARLNHGLAPRDSALLVLDSLRAALFGAQGPAYWSLGRRLDETLLGLLDKRFGDDAQVWYRVAEAGWYWSLAAGLTQEDLLEAYDTVIALDPGFAPAYPRAIELALLERGPEAARRYAAAYLKLNPRGRDADDIRRMDSLLGSRDGARSTPLRPFAGADAGRFSRAAERLQRWPDSAETAVRIYRAVVLSQGDLDTTGFFKFNRERLAQALAYRGHVHEAWRYAPDWLMADLARLGGVPPDSAARIFDGWLRRRGLWPFGLPSGALPWWSARRDTGSLTKFIQRADSLARSHGDIRAVRFAQYTAQRGRGYLALARNDTTRALSLLISVPDSTSGADCPFQCYLDRLTKARLFGAHGRASEAASLLGDARLPPTEYNPLEGLWALEWGRVNERLGRADEARRGYAFTAEVWIHADPELQPYVAEARAALARLGSGAPLHQAP